MRLIDLHADWLLQYAAETTVFDPALYPDVSRRLPQAEVYLQGTSAAILACYREADEWARRADPWGALGDLIARIEAEFSGRVLYGPDDVDRWRDDPDGLCWALIGVEGFDYLVRGPGDLDRISLLFGRGVRLFQMVYGADNALAGSASGGDDRGLTDLGRAFLRTLADLAPAPGGPRPLFDLAHLNPRAAAEALDWFEADEGRRRRVVPLYSHGALAHEGFDTPRAITRENLRRLRALGGTVGFSPSFYGTPDALRAGIEAAAASPFEGRDGVEGIAIGTDFLGVADVLPGLGNAPEVVAWLAATFEPAVAEALTRGNARALFERAAGAAPGSP